MGAAEAVPDGDGGGAGGGGGGGAEGTEGGGAPGRVWQPAKASSAEAMNTRLDIMSFYGSAA